MPAAMVVIPSTSRHATRASVCVDKVHSILSNRIKNGEEQFLVRWTTTAKTNTPPCSWHPINELSRCLEHIQDYVEQRKKAKISREPVQSSSKRKSPEGANDHDRRPSPLDRNLGSNDNSPFTSRSPSVTSTSTLLDITADVYNGELDTDDDGSIICRSETGPGVAKMDIRVVPTDDMLATARHSKIEKANVLIRAEYHRKLRRLPGKKVHLVNNHDYTTPSLRFRFINEYVLGQGVYRLDDETRVGCMRCSPHMGRDIGCEYTKKCDCLEYAAVHEASIPAEDWPAYERAKANGESLMDFPKRFPYFCEGTKTQRAGTLVPFYLNSRNCIYECNDKCRCGPHCRNKNVQFGRVIELEIFLTDPKKGRGWGLRSKEKIYKGQFIDTYRGEIITDAEANRRENASDSHMKASYLYSLDKHQKDSNGDDVIPDEDIYVVDGEFMGGPTKFMNHSCEPNCYQYTVSYNKHDYRIYDLAFFAIRDIPAGEELTFDYLDKDEDCARPKEGQQDTVDIECLEIDREKKTGAEKDEKDRPPVPCHCETPSCRKWLWQ